MRTSNRHTDRWVNADAIGSAYIAGAAIGHKHLDAARTRMTEEIVIAVPLKLVPVHLHIALDDWKAGQSSARTFEVLGDSATGLSQCHCEHICRAGHLQLWANEPLAEMMVMPAKASIAAAK